jgi:hypothetical protein
MTNLECKDPFPFDGLLVSRFVSKKMPNGDEAIRHFVLILQQRLNCALLVVFSLSLDFFRYRGLNGMSEIPKDLRVSRRPIQSLRESKLFRVM